MARSRNSSGASSSSRSGSSKTRAAAGRRKPPRTSPCLVVVAVLLGVGLGVTLALYGCGRILTDTGASNGGSGSATRSRGSASEYGSPAAGGSQSNPAEQTTSVETGQTPATPEQAPEAQNPEQPPTALPRAEPGSVKPPLDSQPPALVRGNPRGSEVALTFDAGASAVPTPVILNALDDAGVKVTFFLTGKWCEKNPEMARRILAAGHEIANHTYDHKELPSLTDAQMVDELQRADEAVYAATGQHTIGWFRPPFGARNKHVLQVAAQAGYRSAYWTLDSWDSVKRDITSAEIESRVVGKLAAGDIVLMHCGSEPTSKALPDILKAVKAKGYRVVKVSELGE